MGFTSFTARLLGGSAVVVGISRTLMLSAFFELVPFSRPVGARTLLCLSVLLGFLLFLGLKLGKSLYSLPSRLYWFLFCFVFFRKEVLCEPSLAQAPTLPPVAQSSQTREPGC